MEIKKNEEISALSNMGKRDGNNEDRLISFGQRAANGELLTVGFFGGSITQGSLASKEEYNYAARVYRWLGSIFPEAVISFFNAGVGGTTSYFGTARAECDLISKKPNLVIIDFSVNDNADPLHEETYEGLVRRILTAASEPAVVALGNAQYNDGKTAENIHKKICDHYHVPYVSIYDRIYKRINAGEFKWQDLSPDGLHPNDRGHALVANAIENVLGEYFYGALKKELDGEKVFSLPEPLTRNRFERTEIYRSDDLKSSLVTSLHGFEPDLSPRKNFREFFKEGWTAAHVGDKISFEFDSCKCLAVQYRKSIHKPAPVAIAILDGDRENAIALDANFKEDWGDCLYIEPIITDDKVARHNLTIEIIEAPEDIKSDFYLLSVIKS